MKSTPEKEFDTDVLIIGGGAAGCLAAIGAREQGAEVLVVEKGGAITRSGSFASGIDHYLAFLSEDSWDTPETFINRVTRARGRPMDIELVTVFARENPRVFRLLESIGIPFRDHSTGQYRRVAGLGDQHPQWVNFEGANIKRIIADYVRRLGVNIEERVMVPDLLTSDGSLAGAVGFHIRDGTPYLFKAKSVVIATGGALRLYPPSSGLAYMSMECPFNSGDGQAMAFRAGARLTNMEFTGSSVVPKGFSAPGITNYVGLGAKLINASGERYMEKYHPLAEHAPRTALVRATMQEIEAGRGPCYVDLRHLSREAIDDIKAGLRNEKPLLLDFFDAKGIDISQEPVPYEVRELSCSGTGIMIDRRCATSLEGLFSAGDCAGWSFAAAGACTLGYVAGTSAARYAANTGQPEIDRRQVTELGERIFAPLGRQAGISPPGLEAELRDIMSQYVGFARDAAKLETAMQLLEGLRNRVAELVAHDYHELMRANESANLMEVARVVARAAYERKETRAAPSHIRTDYPAKDDANWFGFLVVEKQGDGLGTSYRPLLPGN